MQEGCSRECFGHMWRYLQWSRVYLEVFVRESWCKDVLIRSVKCTLQQKTNMVVYTRTQQQTKMNILDQCTWVDEQCIQQDVQEILDRYFCGCLKLSRAMLERYAKIIMVVKKHFSRALRG